MDIFHLIKEDHDHVRKILEDLTANSNSPQGRKNLFAELKSELLLHNNVEELVFYATLKKDDTVLRPLIDQSHQEHDQVEHLLKEMNAMDPSTSEWGQKIEQIKKLTLQHMEKEEGDIFKKAREILQEGHEKKLGQRFQDLKQHMLREDDIENDDIGDEEREFED